MIVQEIFRDLKELTMRAEKMEQGVEGETKTEAPKEFPRKASSGSGGVTGYSVEARLNYHEPRTISGQIFDNRWSTVHFQQTVPPFGVPSGRRYNSCWYDQTGLFSYQAAQALRWWFLANAEVEFSCLCLETRLIEHEIKYSYSSTGVKAGAVIGGDDRSNIMFGWGEKTPVTT